MEQRKGDHIRFTFQFNSELSSIRTKISHGSKNKEISDNLVSTMANQCKVTKSDFVKLAKCEISESDYIELVKHHLPKGG